MKTNEKQTIIFCPPGPRHTYHTTTNQWGPLQMNIMPSCNKQRQDPEVSELQMPRVPTLPCGPVGRELGSLDRLFSCGTEVPLHLPTRCVPVPHSIPKRQLALAGDSPWATASAQLQKVSVFSFCFVCVCVFFFD